MSTPTSTTFPDLHTRRVVIPGGTGAVGEGIVRAQLASGAEVIVPSRSQERIDEFRAVLGEDGNRPNLHLIVGEYTTFDAATELAARIHEEFGPVTDVIATIGGWWAGKGLWQISQSDWDRYFVGLTTAHMAVLRAFMADLPTVGSYQLILGGSALRPVPGSGLISMEQAALLMMSRVLAAEVGQQRQIHTLILGPVLNRLRGGGDPDWVSADEVGLVTTLLAAHPNTGSVEVGLRSKQDVADTIATLTGSDTAPATPTE